MVLHYRGDNLSIFQELAAESFEAPVWVMKMLINARRGVVCRGFDCVADIRRYDIEMARHDNRHLRLFGLPGSRFSQYWRVIRRYDVRVLESSVTNDDEQFELDYQITYLVMCRLGYDSRVLARATKFDLQLTAYLVRQDIRILDESEDLDLIAVLAYRYLVLNTRESWVKKAIDRILVTQNAIGAWGTNEEMHLDMYDRMHATWTAVTALCHSLSKQAS